MENAKVRWGMVSCFAAVAVAAIALSLAMAPGMAFADGGNPMYRLYNPYSGEHFYTASAAEHDDVVAVGWTDEGIGWTAPSTGDPVYRLYNSYAGEHHYTLSVDERDSLVAAGWTDEGTGWFSDPNHLVPLFREYNPNEFSCNHNYTTGITEHNGLVELGWADEGIAWYGTVSGEVTVEVDYADGVVAVDASYAEVSDDGRTATVEGSALGGKPRVGDIVVVADDDLQGTAIKVEGVTANADGSYTVKGSEPAFEEVFDELHLTGERSVEGAKVTYLAPGVVIVDGQADDLSTQGIGMGGKLHGETVSLQVGAEVFGTPDSAKPLSASVSADVSVDLTPWVEYDVWYEFGRFKRAKAVVHMGYGVDGYVDGSVELTPPIGVFQVGPMEFEAYLAVGLEGKIGVVTEGNAFCGLDWSDGDDSLPLVAGLTNDGASPTIEVQGKLGLGAEGGIGVACFDLASVYAELGVKADVQLQRRTSGLMCDDRAWWLYLEAGVNVMKEIADIGNFDANLSKEFLSQDNSPVKGSEHWEDGKLVDECTWGSDSSSTTDPNLEKAYELYSDVIDEWIAGMAYEATSPAYTMPPASTYPYVSGHWYGAGMPPKRSGLVYTLISLDDNQMPFLMVADPLRGYRIWGIYCYDELYDGGTLAYQTYSYREQVHLCVNGLIRLYFYGPAMEGVHIDESVGRFSCFENDAYSGVDRVISYALLARTEGNINDANINVWYDVNGNVVEQGSAYNDMRTRFEAAYPVDEDVIWEPVSDGFDPAPFSNQLSSRVQVETTIQSANQAYYLKSGGCIEL